MSHGFYIFMAWGISAVVIFGLIGTILMNGRNRQRELKELEQAGIRRRSVAGEFQQ